MLQHRHILLDCCNSPNVEPTSFAFHTRDGEYWALLHCKGCGRHWCHAADSTGVECFTPLLGRYQPSPSLLLGPAIDLSAVRRRHRTLCVTAKSQEWINPPDWRPGRNDITHHMVDSLITKAREVAIASHDACGHTRSDGAPYWTHPRRVAATLAAHGLPAEVLAAAWLHDVAEDCAVDEADSRAILKTFGTEFGPVIASLVAEVTNYFGPEATTMEEKQVGLREHARTMSDSAKWIKLADRWDNISGMVGWSSDKRRRYATSTRLLLEALEPWPKWSETLVVRISEATATQLDAP